MSLQARITVGKKPNRPLQLFFVVLCLSLYVLILELQGAQVSGLVEAILAETLVLLAFRL